MSLKFYVQNTKFMHFRGSFENFKSNLGFYLIISFVYVHYFTCSNIIKLQMNLKKKIIIILNLKNSLLFNFKIFLVQQIWEWKIEPST